MTAGPIDLTVNFLSPVEVSVSSTSYPTYSDLHVYRSQPNDLVKQSLPFSYLSLSAKSADGKAHAVQVYSDISAEWITGDNSLTANWTTTVGDVIIHQTQLAEQTTFSEINDRIQRM